MNPEPRTAVDALAEALLNSDAGEIFAVTPKDAAAILAALPEGWHLVQAEAHADTARPVEPPAFDAKRYSGPTSHFDAYEDGIDVGRKQVQPDTVRPVEPPDYFYEEKVHPFVRVDTSGICGECKHIEETRCHSQPDIAAGYGAHSHDAIVCEGCRQNAVSWADHMTRPLRAQVAVLREALLKLGGQCVLADKNFPEVLAHASAVLRDTARPVDEWAGWYKRHQPWCSLDLDHMGDCVHIHDEGHPVPPDHDEEVAARALHDRLQSRGE